MNQKWLKECERRIAEAPFVDESITLEALGQLSNFYTGTCNSRIARAFARLVRDSRGSSDLRIIAYIGLLQVIGELTTRQPQLRTFVLDNDVDWRLVERYESAWPKWKLFFDISQRWLRWQRKSDK
jgi:hypothetical protein